MGKYDALYHFLEHIQPDVRGRTLNFDEVEKILGFKLPKSAYAYPQWRANPTSPQQHPHAQMGFVNEAVFYLSFLPKHVIRFVVMRKDTHRRRDETLADYCCRTYHHLLQGVFVLEIDLENNT